MTDAVKGLFEDIKNVDAALANMAKLFTQADNIHNHSRSLGASCRTTFYPLDNKYSFSQKKPLTLELVIKKILAHAQWVQEPNIAAIQTVLSSIQRAGASVEAETGLNVADLLVRTWSLAEQASWISNSKECILDNLKHNIAAAGGCLAGISTRLVQPYSALIKEHLENNLENKLNLALNSKPHYPVESDFDRAIRESLENVHIHTRYENDTKNSYNQEIQEIEDATAMALALKNSLDEVKNKKRADDELAQVLKLSLAAEQLRVKAKPVQPLAPAQQQPVAAFVPRFAAAAVLPLAGRLVGGGAKQSPQEKAEAVFRVAEGFVSDMHRSPNKIIINKEIHAHCADEDEYKKIVKAFQGILLNKIENKDTAKMYNMASSLLAQNVFKYDARLHPAAPPGPGGP